MYLKITNKITPLFISVNTISFVLTHTTTCML